MSEEKVRRTRTELIAELQDQVVLLEQACKIYDEGVSVAAKHMSVSLRVLLHHKNRSRALLQQLKLREKHFLDSGTDIRSDDLFSQFSLCVLSAGKNADSSYAGYEARCLAQFNFDDSWLKFPKWWNKAVVKDQNGKKFTRKDLVLYMADCDGGAHVDPALDAQYDQLVKRNSLGVVFCDGDLKLPLKGVELASIRQISHEVLETLKVKAKGVVDISYEIKQ